MQIITIPENRLSMVRNFQPARLNALSHYRPLRICMAVVDLYRDCRFMFSRDILYQTKILHYLYEEIAITYLVWAVLTHNIFSSHNFLFLETLIFYLNTEVLLNYLNHSFVRVVEAY